MAFTPTLVYAEATPNPSTVKFVANRLIIEPGRQVEYLSEESCSGSPLAKELFRGGYVKTLFFSSNFVSITKTDSKDWTSLTGPIREFLTDYFTKGLPVIEEYPEISAAPQQEAQSQAVAGSPEEQIIGILEEYIRPAVEQDGGAITFRSFDDGVVTVALQGSCSGCPSSKVTLKSGIENLLTRMVPGVKEVVAEDL
ncbi:MAG: NifU family protein [Bacteroidetes bacterium]|nr:NifU family protein [Bacteroidota bacterium]